MKNFIYLLFLSALVLSCSSDDDGEQQQQTATCARPSSLQSLNIGFDRFSVSYTQASAASFIIEYGESGFTLGSGTQEPSIFRETEITGLESGVTYDVYVQAICANDLESEFAGPISVRTRDE